jgi:transposase
LLEVAAGAEARSEPAAPCVDLKSLQAKIGELTLENDFLEVALGKAGLPSARR